MRKYDEYVISKDYYHRIVDHVGNADYKFYRSHATAFLMAAICVCMNIVMALVIKVVPSLKTAIITNGVIAGVLFALWGATFLIPKKTFIQNRRNEFEKAVFDAAIEKEINQITEDPNA